MAALGVTQYVVVIVTMAITLMIAPVLQAAGAQVAAQAVVEVVAQTAAQTTTQANQPRWGVQWCRGMGQWVIVVVVWAAMATVAAAEQ